MEVIDWLINAFSTMLYDLFVTRIKSRILRDPKFLRKYRRTDHKKQKDIKL